MAKKVEVKLEAKVVEQIGSKPQSVKGLDFKQFENKKEINCLIIPVSSEAKTGPITCTYTGCNTCPKCCPLQDICYGRYGNCRLHNLRVSAGFAGISIWELRNWLKTHAHTDLIRHNVVGDLAKTGTSDIDEKLLDELIEAYRPWHAYTYSHCKKTERNLGLMKKATDEGFVISASCETLEEVKKVMKAGVNAVITVSTMEDKVKTVDGVKIVRCPNAADSTKQCCNCKLCAMKKRDFAIAFPVHGCKKTKAQKSGKLLDI